MLSLDVYSLPHKALRASLADAGTALGAADSDTFMSACEIVSASLDELVAHADHEDSFVQPVIERFLPDTGADVAGQHAALHLRLDAMRRQLETATTEPSARAATYRSYQRLIAHNLAHLDHEESVVLPALWSAVPARVLDDLMARFRAAHPEATELYRRHANALTTAENALFTASASTERPASTPLLGDARCTAAAPLPDAGLSPSRRRAACRLD